MNSVTWDDRTAARPEVGLVSAPLPVLIGCSHGTNDPEGRRVIRVAAAPLGPDPRLVAILLDRLAQAGAGDGDAVVLAAAGSSRPESARDVECLAEAGQTRRYPIPRTVSKRSLPSLVRR